MKIEDIAKAAHMVNRIYDISLGGVPYPYFPMSGEEMSSTVSGIEFLMSISPGIDITPSMIHDNWLNNKVSNGWVYGKEKDGPKKTHPCLLPFEELTKEQQTKDVFFINIVIQLLPFLD